MIHANVCPKMTQNMLMTRSPFKLVMTLEACLVASKVGTVLQKEKAVIKSCHLTLLLGFFLPAVACSGRQQDLIPMTDRIPNIMTEQSLPSSLLAFSMIPHEKHGKLKSMKCRRF